MNITHYILITLFYKLFQIQILQIDQKTKS